MTMKWFGASWGAPFCEADEHIETPVGETCVHCDEPIAENDQGIVYANGPIAHLNCFLRGIHGSLAHIEKRCSCYVPGATCTDPEGMTKREAANAAVEAVEKYMRRMPK